jgi:hypothetical protein
MSNYNEEQEQKKNKKEIKKKDLKGTQKLWLWHQRYHRKDFDEMNPMTSRNVINGDQSKSHVTSDSLSFEKRVWPTLVTSSYFSLVLLDLFHKYLFDDTFGVVTGALMYF